MALIKLIDDEPVIEANDWAHPENDAPLPAEAPIVVSLERWKAEHDALAARNAPVGIRLRSDERIDQIAEDLANLPLVELDFPNMNDGRHFTSARLLRERHGYRGEIRATGQVLRDQLFFMARCGFDAFELPADKDGEAALNAFREISVVYQPAVDRRSPVQAWRLRDRYVTAAE